MKCIGLYFTKIDSSCNHRERHWKIVNMSFFKMLSKWLVERFKRDLYNVNLNFMYVIAYRERYKSFELYVKICSYYAIGGRRCKQ